MEVGGTLQLWTIFYGWHLNNLIWGLLVSTNLVFLPVVGFLVDHLIDVRSGAASWTADEDALMSPIEVKLFTMILVVMLAVKPYGSTAINAGNVTYTPKASVWNPASSVRRFNNTSTRFDDVLTATTYDPASGSIPVPPAWFVVMQVSNGFRHALVQGIDDRGDVFRALRGMVNRASITDPELKSRIEDFHTECYLPALNQYMEDENRTDVVGPAPGSDLESADIGWMGSAYFQTQYYSTMRVPHAVAGFMYDADVDTRHAPGYVPLAGAPLCSEYWQDTRDRIYKKAEDEGAVGIVDRASGFVSWVAGVGDPAGAVGTDNFRDGIARTYLNNTDLQVSQTQEDLIALRRGNVGVFEGAVRGAADAFQVTSLAKDAAKLELFVEAVISFLVYLHAYSLWVLYMFVGLALWMGGYSWQTVKNVAVAIFVINMYPVVWTAVAWMDNSNGLALWKGQSYVQTLTNGNLAAVKARLIHSLIFGVLYLLSAGIFIGVVLLSGVKSAYAVAQAGRAASGGSGVPLKPVGPGANSAGQFVAGTGRQAGTWAADKAGGAARRALK